jgi:hypothetical protein
MVLGGKNGGMRVCAQVREGGKRKGEKKARDLTVRA